MLTSQDILFFVLSFCALWATLFLTWFLWQLAVLFRNVNEAVADAKEKFCLIERALSGMKERMEQASSIVAVAARGLESLFSYLSERKAGKGGKGRKAPKV